MSSVLDSVVNEASVNKTKMSQAEDNIAKRKKYTEELITAHMNAVPKASKQVLQFIADFMYHGTPDVIMEDSAESVRSTFRAGYCYYFAEMLKIAFNRGCVCWAAPFSHIVWCDTNGVAYDIEGVYFGEAEYLVPISYIEDSLWSFKHVPNVEGVVRDSGEIIKEFEYDLKSGVLQDKGLGYVDYGYM